MKKTATLKIEIEYDDACTDADSIASALDTLLETSLSTPGIFEEYGPVELDSFFVEQKERIIKPDPGEDNGSSFILEGEAIWIKVGDLDVNVLRTDEGVAVDIWKDLHVGDPAGSSRVLASAYAFFGED